jgi:hypothetical protein
MKNNTNIQQESSGSKPKKKKILKACVYTKSLFSDVEGEQDPLKWWDVNKGKFPILAQLACKYLSIQATSGASERVFSDNVCKKNTNEGRFI